MLSETSVSLPVLAKAEDKPDDCKPKFEPMKRILYPSLAYLLKAETSFLENLRLRVNCVRAAFMVIFSTLRTNSGAPLRSGL